MCFKGSIPKNWWCKGSKQVSTTVKVTTSKTSVLASHGTVADNWISWCLSSKQWRWIFTKRHGSVLIRIAWAIDEGRNVVWKIDFERQKIARTVLSTAVAELYSFMKCFGSCQFFSGLWMDLSGEVAKIHMRTDAKNLVTTARTIHLPEQN